jgi:putative aldouronate transport system substrate-binding protein
MNKYVKLLSASLAVWMILLSACSSKGSEITSSAGSSGSKEKTAELVLALPIPGNTPKDMQTVEDEINKIALKKINAKVKITPISLGSYAQQIILKMTANENVDIFYVSKDSNFSGQANKGQLLPLNDLVDKYGQDLMKAHHSEYLKASTINGKLYAIPVIQNYVDLKGIVMRKDLVEKYNIDVGKIKSLDDLDQVFKTIKDHETNVIPVVPLFPGISILPNWYDQLGDSLGVLPNYDNNLKAVDIFETPEYAQKVKKVRSWYQAGYIQQDVATSKDNGQELIKAGRAFATFAPQAPGSDALNTKIIGTPMVGATLSSTYINTTNISNNMWAIPSNSKNPEKAMSFLNLMFSDPDIVNLLDWGIEGKHYVKVSDNQVDFPNGQNASNSNYYPNWNWLVGNQFLSYLTKGDAPDLWKKMDDFNNQATRSKALGFTFDQAPVKTEVVAVNNVVSQYKVALESGALDPDTVLPEFIKKLKAAGIDKIVAEKQKQLDDWAKTNK